jgi:hypothetical protein
MRHHGFTLMRDTPAMLRELNVVEQRYQNVLQVLDDIPVTEVVSDPSRAGQVPLAITAITGLAQISNWPAHAASPARNASMWARLISRRRPALTDLSWRVRSRSKTSSRLIPRSSAASSGVSIHGGEGEVGVTRRARCLNL